MKVFFLWDTFSHIWQLLTRVIYLYLQRVYFLNKTFLGVMQYIFIQYMILRDVLGNKIHPMTNLKISLCGGLDNILLVGREDPETC